MNRGASQALRALEDKTLPVRLSGSWVFLLAVMLDTVYQLLVFKGLRPIQGLLVAVLLALVPYVLLRGPVNRIARGLLHRRASGH